MSNLDSRDVELPFDVLIVGAGLSGIGAAYHLQTACPNKRYAILEARDTIGGTWDLFRYPGVRSDSDMVTLGYRFKPWLSAQTMAAGATIKRYIQEAADDGDIVRHIRFGHKVVSAAWSSAHACWTVEVARTTPDHTSIPINLQARFLYLCSGYYSYEKAHRPHFTNEEAYSGKIVEPQFWPDNLDYTGKRIIIIGSGATAVTLAPALAKSATHVTLLQRSASYIVKWPAEDRFAKRWHARLPAQIAYRLVRCKNILTGILLYRTARKRPAEVKARLISMLARQLEPNYDIAKHFTPNYQPWDQRVCATPDGDFFRAIREGDITMVTDTVECFTPTGLQLTSGNKLDADIVVLATGLILEFMGKIALSIDGQACDPGECMAYKGMMLSDVPNLAMTFGYINASWTLKADLTSRYVCRLLKYMDQKRFAVAVPCRDQAIPSQPFLPFSSSYVQRAKGQLPQQGTRAPWIAHQNYLLDWVEIRFGRIADGTMRFDY